MKVNIDLQCNDNRKIQYIIFRKNKSSQSTYEENLTTINHLESASQSVIDLTLFLLDLLL